MLFGFEIDDIIKQVCAMPVYVAHKLFESVFGMKYLCSCLALLIRTQVCKRDADASIEESQLAHAPCNDVPLEMSSCKNGLIGPELLACTSLVGFSNDLYRVERFSPFVFLLIDFAISEYLRCHVR